MAGVVPNADDPESHTAPPTLEAAAGASGGTNPGPRRSGPILFLLALGVGAGVTAAHWPVLSSRALSMNDGRYLTHNYSVQHPSWESAKRFLGEVRRPSTVPGYYQPLAMISLMLDSAAGGNGENLRPYHRTALALHVANTVLIIVLLYQLLGRVWPAALAGLLFGVHPMTVEAIAWIGERKTPLATFFALACLNLYVSYAHKKRTARYLACLAAFLLALMAKPTVVPLPVLLLLLDAWPLRRLDGRAILEKVPFVVLAAAGAVVTVLSQRHMEIAGHRELSLADQALLVCHNIVFYPLKMLWPSPLSSVYPFPDSIGLSDPRVLAGLAGTVLIVAGALVALRWTRALLVGGLFFVAALSPTLVNIGYSMGVAADKYAYFPVLGLLLILGWLLGRLWGERGTARRPRLPRIAPVLAALLIAAVEARATRQYLQVWQTSETLARHILTVAPGTAWAHEVLGLELLENDRVEASIEHLEKAVELQPKAPTAHVNLGRALVRLGDAAEARRHFARAVELKPDLPEARLNLANRLAADREFDQAIHHYEQALRYKPGFPRAHHGLGLALAATGRVDEAMAHQWEAIRLDPAYAEPHFRLADLLMKKGRTDQAISHYLRAVQLGLIAPVLHNDLGIALSRLGHRADAIAQIRRALALDPNYPEAHHNLAILLAEAGELRGAEQALREAVRLRPGNADTLCTLGNVLAAQDRNEEAAEQYRKALAIRPNHPQARRGLAEAEKQRDGATER